MPASRLGKAAVDISTLTLRVGTCRGTVSTSPPGYSMTVAEQTFMREVLESFDARAKEAESTVVPGMGFYYALGDMLAHLVAGGRACTVDHDAASFERAAQRVSLHDIGRSDLGFPDRGGDALQRFPVSTCEDQPASASSELRRDPLAGAPYTAMGRPSSVMLIPEAHSRSSSPSVGPLNRDARGGAPNETLPRATRVTDGAFGKEPWD